ncbi:hypothetical protein FQN53_004820 [Emmonsiellopsis sp. PD_33]|nr:hypothetical protein FQN53_004820 [Emmonsiellopsis sp. PD_33]
MLLPSALSCDSRQHPTTRARFAASRLFPSTPPPNDDSFIAGNGLLGTCRALQSLLNSSPASTPRRAKPERLQSPLHVRPQTITRAQKVVKKQAPPRGVNKRRREVYEDDSDREMGMGMGVGGVGAGLLGDGFLTPKRRRRAPEELPLGLGREDFRRLDVDTPVDGMVIGARFRSNNADCDGGAECDDDATISIPEIRSDDDDTVPCSSSPDPNSDWSSEDDRRLVELVLEKLKLSKRDWNECARKMGKDNDSVGRRWKALVGEGNVGLRRGRRMVRGRIDESWRCDR